MAILVVIIRCLAAVMAGQQDDKVGQQVGQRMDTIGHQRLRFGKYADQDLGAGQYDIDPYADHGAAVRGFVACGFIYRFVEHGWCVWSWQSGPDRVGSAVCHSWLKFLLIEIYWLVNKNNNKNDLHFAGVRCRSCQNSSC
jgi:hypothetical protein